MIAPRHYADWRLETRAAARRSTPGRLETLDLGDLIRSSRGILSRILGKDIGLELALNPKPAWIEGDRGQLRRLLVDVALHAREAIPQGGVLTLSTRRTTLEGEAAAEAGLPVGPYHEVQIQERRRDCGPRGRRPVVEADPEALAAAFEIVARHQGRLRLQQNPSRSQSFWLLLPETRSGSARGHETILLVDDAPVQRRVAGRILRERGYRVIEAASGREALEQLEAEGLRPDLVVADVVMPGLSGPEMVRHMRLSLPQIQVLYMSAYADTERAGLDPKAVLLPKPFTPAGLAWKVRESLDSRARRATA